MTFLKFFAVALTINCLPLIPLTQSVPPSEWQNIDADGLFNFRLPQGFTKTKLTGVENYLGEYYKGESRLLFIWGDTASLAYSDRRQPEMHDYTELNTRIRGKRANIRTYWETKNAKRIYHAELNVGNWEKGQIELYMGLESNDPTILETANQVFKSIVFPNPIPERPDNSWYPQITQITPIQRQQYLGPAQYLCNRRNLWISLEHLNSDRDARVWH